MKIAAIISFFICLVNANAQEKMKNEDQYYCPPCGCKYDDKQFDKPGRCPDCRMGLLKVGTFNYEIGSVSSNGIIVYKSNKQDNTPKVFFRSLNSDRNETSLAAGGRPLITKDGTAILFGARDSEIFIYDISSGKITNLTPRINLPNLQTPAWDHEDRDIFFCSGYFPSIGIYKFNRSGGTVRTVLADSALRYGISPSPDGRKIAYRCVKGGGEQKVQKGIAVYDLSTGKEDYITAIGEYPAWSPDGKTLAFHWSESGSFYIYTVNADGTGLKQLTTVAQGNCELPTWSPDGTKIYFQTNHRQGNWEIWTMNADGRDPKPLIW